MATIKKYLPLLLCALVLVACYAAYKHGYNTAAVKGEAALLAARLDWQEDKRAQADAYAQAVADALAQYEENVRHGDAITVKLTKDRADHEATAKNVQAQARALPDGSTVIFTAADVRLLNEAAGVYRPAKPESVCAARADGEACGAGSSAGKGHE